MSIRTRRKEKQLMILSCNLVTQLPKGSQHEREPRHKANLRGIGTATRVPRTRTKEIHAGGEEELGIINTGNGQYQSIRVGFSTELPGIPATSRSRLDLAVIY